MNPKHYHHYKISTTFFDLLHNGVDGIKDVNTVYTAHNFISFVSNLLYNSSINNDKFTGQSYVTADGRRFVQVSHNTIEQYFGKGYTPYINKLKNEGLLLCDGIAIHTDNIKDSRCFSYNLTPLCMSLLTDSIKAYFRNDQNFMDTKVAEKAKNALKNNREINLWQRNMLQNLTHIQIDYNAIQADLEELQKCPELLAHLYYVINTLMECGSKKSEITVNPKTGRYYDILKFLPKEFQRYIKMANTSICVGIDMRAGHPTLFGFLIRDTYTAEMTEIDKKALDIEIDNYITLFTGDNDPRQEMATFCGCDVYELKDVFNKYLNGGTPQYSHRLDQFLTTRFPNMIKLWKNYIPLAETGCRISKHYESKIFRSDAVLTRLKMRKLSGNIRLAEKHDELIIYAEYQHDVDSVLQIIEEISQRVFKVSFRFKSQRYMADVFTSYNHKVIHGITALDGLRRELSGKMLRYKDGRTDDYPDFGMYHKAKIEYILFIRSLPQKGLTDIARSTIQVFLHKNKRYSKRYIDSPFSIYRVK